MGWNNLAFAQPNATKFGQPDSNIIAMTVNPTTPNNNIPPNQSGPGPLGVLIGILIIMFLFHIFQRVNGSKIQPFHIDMGAYNVAVIGTTAIGTIAVMKLFLNWLHIPYATDLINFV